MPYNEWGDIDEDKDLYKEKNNQEYIFDKKPYRIKNKKYLHDLELSLKNLNPNFDFKDLYEYEEIH